MCHADGSLGKLSRLVGYRVRSLQGEGALSHLGCSQWMVPSVDQIKSQKNPVHSRYVVL